MRQTVRKNPAECTGCGACVSICPKQAIVMQPDTEGFLYPKVDGEKCISCDLCEKRCPAGREMPEHHARLLGAQAKDEALRRQSSSGGVFTLLAREVIRRGGVVFGAAFGENMRVEHVGAFDETELSGMRGSKYVQSDATDAIGNAVSLLKREIPVLFSGTPCQINGLLAALGNTKSDKLLTVDFVCHGVPSPGVFASYLVELEKSTEAAFWPIHSAINGWDGRTFPPSRHLKTGRNTRVRRRQNPIYTVFCKICICDRPAIRAVSFAVSVTRRISRWLICGERRRFAPNGMTIRAFPLSWLIRRRADRRLNRAECSSTRFQSGISRE